MPLVATKPCAGDFTRSVQPGFVPKTLRPAQSFDRLNLAGQTGQNSRIRTQAGTHWGCSRHESVMPRLGRQDCKLLLFAYTTTIVVRFADCSKYRGETWQR